MTPPTIKEAVLFAFSSVLFFAMIILPWFVF